MRVSLQYAYKSMTRSPSLDRNEDDDNNTLSPRPSSDLQQQQCSSE